MFLYLIYFLDFFPYIAEILLFPPISVFVIFFNSSNFVTNGVYCYIAFFCQISFDYEVLYIYIYHYYFFFVGALYGLYGSTEKIYLFLSLNLYSGLEKPTFSVCFVIEKKNGWNHQLESCHVYTQCQLHFLRKNYDMF